MKNRRDAGYIGLEAIVAFAVLTLALTGLYQALSISYRLAASATHKERAMMVGQSKLSEALSGARLDEQTQGQLPDGSHWTLTRVPTTTQNTKNQANAEWLIFKAKRSSGTIVLELKTLQVGKRTQ